MVQVAWVATGFTSKLLIHHLLLAILSVQNYYNIASQWHPTRVAHDLDFTCEQGYTKSSSTSRVFCTIPNTWLSMPLTCVPMPWMISLLNMMICTYMCGESTLQLRNVVPIASLLPPTILVYIVAISVTMLKKDKDLKTLTFRGWHPGHRKNY